MNPCHQHQDQPSLARCTRCNQDICHLCHGSDLRGFAVCTACRREATRAGTPWEDTNSESTAAALVQTWWDAIRSPGQFWGPIPADGRWIPAVVFGIIFITLGSFASTTYELLFNEEIDKLLRDAVDNPEVPMSALRALSYARIPIIAPFVFGFHTVMLNAAVGIAGGKADIKTTAKIFGYACAGYTLMLIPPIAQIPIGHMLMIMWVFNIEIAGVRRFYDLSQFRAMFVVIIPMLIAITLRCV